MHSTFRAALTIAVGLALSAPAAPKERSASQQEYWAQFDQRDWTAAISVAQALVAQAREDASKRPLDLAEALTLLGNAQLGATDYVSAERAFAEALALVEKYGNPMGRELLDPLRGLGYTLAAAGRHVEAVPMLERALLIAHRNYGLFDMDQQGLLRQLAGSLTYLGRASEAERHMDYLVQVAERTYGENDPRIVPLLSSVAKWRSDTARFETAREMYRRAISIVNRKLGKNHLAAVEPLRGLAETYTKELHYSTLGLRVATDRVPTNANGRSNDNQPINPRYLSSKGEKALERALKIIEAQPQPPQELLAETLIQLGDWRQIKHRPEDAMPLYRRAAAVLADARPAADEAERSASDEPPRRPLLSFPVHVYYPTPTLASRNLGLPEDAVEESFVEVEFTVTSTGEVRNARVVDQNGTSRQAGETLEAIRASRFRPRFEGGEPVATTGVQHREVFKTRKSAVDNSADS